MSLVDQTLVKILKTVGVSKEGVVENLREEDVASYQAQWKSLVQGSEMMDAVPLEKARKYLLDADILPEKNIDQVLEHFDQKELVEKKTFFSILSVLSLTIERVQNEIFSEDIFCANSENTQTKKDMMANPFLEENDDGETSQKKDNWAIAAIAAARGIVLEENAPEESQVPEDSPRSSSGLNVDLELTCDNEAVEAALQLMSPSSTWKAFDRLTLDENNPPRDPSVQESTDEDFNHVSLESMNSSDKQRCIKVFNDKYAQTGGFPRAEAIRMYQSLDKISHKDTNSRPKPWKESFETFQSIWNYVIQSIPQTTDLYYSHEMDHRISQLSCDQFCLYVHVLRSSAKQLETGGKCEHVRKLHEDSPAFHNFISDTHHVRSSTTSCQSQEKPVMHIPTGKFKVVVHGDQATNDSEKSCSQQSMSRNTESNSFGEIDKANIDYRSEASIDEVLDPKENTNKKTLVQQTLETGSGIGTNTLKIGDTANVSSSDDDSDTQSVASFASSSFSIARRALGSIVTLPRSTHSSVHRFGDGGQSMNQRVSTSRMEQAAWLSEVGPGHAWLEFSLLAVVLMNKKLSEKPFVSLSIFDALGRLIELPQDSHPGTVHKGIIDFGGQTIRLKTALREIPAGSKIFFEIKQWKGQKRRFSTVAWSYISSEMLLDSGPICCRIRCGHIRLPLFKKPLDTSLQNCKRLNSRQPVMHVSLRGISEAEEELK